MSELSHSWVTKIIYQYTHPRYSQFVNQSVRFYSEVRLTVLPCVSNGKYRHPLDFSSSWHRLQRQGLFLPQVDNIEVNFTTWYDAVAEAALSIAQWPIASLTCHLPKNLSAFLSFRIPWIVVMPGLWVMTVLSTVVLLNSHCHYLYYYKPKHFLFVSLSLSFVSLPGSEVFVERKIFVATVTKCLLM